MIIIYIISAITLVIAAAMLLPLSVRIIYRDELSVYAGIAFVRIKVFPSKEKLPAEKKAAVRRKKKKASLIPEKAPEESNEGAESVKRTEEKEKKPIKDTLLLIVDLVKSLLDVMGKHAVFKVKTLKVTVSRQDAADTAIHFALCQGAVSTLLALSGEFAKAKINESSINVAPDFVSGKSSLEADISLSAAAGALLFGAVKGYLRNQSR